MKIKILGLLMISVVLLSFTYNQSNPWSVPDKNAKMANPVKTDAASLKLGKEMWTKHCAACHGKTGMGDGTKAASLKTTMEDMTKPAVQGQSDGALFYKISTGRDEMPSFKKKIADPEDLWAIVNYMRTFKK